MADIRTFTAMAVDSELSLLCRLHAMLESDSITSRAQFGDLMKVSFNNCHLDARKLSDDLGYSCSTVYRWIEGRTAPHPSLWPRVAGWISDELKARIDSTNAREYAEA